MIVVHVYAKQCCRNHAEKSYHRGEVAYNTGIDNVVVNPASSDPDTTKGN